MEVRRNWYCPCIVQTEILILDEPTTGLDPQTRWLIWNIIEKPRKTENMTVFWLHIIWKRPMLVMLWFLTRSVAAEGTPFELKNDYVQDIVSVYGVSEDEIKSLNREYKNTWRISDKSKKWSTALIEHQDYSWIISSKRRYGWCISCSHRKKLEVSINEYWR